MVSQNSKNLKQRMKLNWNFQRGGWVMGQIPSVGWGDGYFLEQYIDHIWT